MNEFLVAQMALLEASRTRVIGMQAENEQRKIEGKSLAYTEDAFFGESREQDAIYQRICQYG